MLSLALDVPISYFFEPSTAGGSQRYVRAQGRAPPAAPHGERVLKEALTPAEPGELEHLRADAQSRRVVGTTSSAIAGRRRAFVLAGKMRLWLDHEAHLLDAGDSFRFPSELAAHVRQSHPAGDAGDLGDDVCAQADACRRALACAAGPVTAPRARGWSPTLRRATGEHHPVRHAASRCAAAAADRRRSVCSARLKQNASQPSRRRSRSTVFVGFRRSGRARSWSSASPPR